MPHTPLGPTLSRGILCHPKSSPSGPNGRRLCTLLPQPARSCRQGQPTPWAPRGRKTEEPPRAGPHGVVARCGFRLPLLPNPTKIQAKPVELH